jgi:hypothetical protein
VLLQSSIARALEGLSVAHARATYEGDQQRLLAAFRASANIISSSRTGADEGEEDQLLSLNRSLKEALIQGAVQVGGVTYAVCHLSPRVHHQHCCQSDGMM